MNGKNSILFRAKISAEFFFKMNFYVLYLESGQIVALEQSWVENPVVGGNTKVFVSKNVDAIANFTLETLFYIDENVDATYNALVYKSFGNVFSKF